MKALCVAVGLGLLVVGLSLVAWPVLDALPLPGRSGEHFRELWFFGIPITWMGLRVFRRGLGKGAAGQGARPSPAGSVEPAVPVTRGHDEGGIEVTRVEARGPRTISIEELAELDALYAEHRPTAWGAMVEELRAIRRVVEAGTVVQVEGGPALRTWEEFYDWAHGRYHMLEDGADHWIGDDRS